MIFCIWMTFHDHFVNEQHYIDHFRSQINIPSKVIYSEFKQQKMCISLFLPDFSLQNFENINRAGIHEGS